MLEWRKDNDGDVVAKGKKGQYGIDLVGLMEDQMESPVYRASFCPQSSRSVTIFRGDMEGCKAACEIHNSVSQDGA